MTEALLFALLVILTEAVTEILVESVLLERPRAWLAGKDEGTLRFTFVRCGYCVSLWIGVGLAYALWFVPFEGSKWWQPLALGAAAHRLSNIWHDFIRRHRLQRGSY